MKKTPEQAGFSYDTLLDMNLQLPMETLVDHLIYNTKLLCKHNMPIQSHPIGFLNIPFMDIGRYNGVALHIWKDDIPGIDSLNVHTHVFHLQSRVLHGSVTNKIWDVIDDKQGKYQVSEGRCEGSNMLLSNPKSVDIKVKSVATHSSGDIYEVLKDQYHSSVTKPGTVTLVSKTSRDTSANPLIVKPTYGENKEDCFNSFQFPQDKAWEIVHETLQNIRDAK